MRPDGIDGQDRGAVPRSSTKKHMTFVGDVKTSRLYDLEAGPEFISLLFGDCRRKGKGRNIGKIDYERRDLIGRAIICFFMGETQDRLS